jgi:tetratricopeptide (TPR) repeat protein
MFAYKNLVIQLLVFSITGINLQNFCLCQQPDLQPASPQIVSSEPVVAKMEMKLTLKDEVLDTIEKGDLLTVLEVREKSYLIQTFSGHKGAVSNVTVSKLAEAAPIYDELIEKNPEEGRLYTLRASCHWAVGDTEKAIADFDKAIELGYNEAHAFASRGLFHAAMRNYDKALADYSEAIQRDPKDDVPLLNRAGVNLSMGKYEAAIEDYTAAIKLRPESPVLHTQRAIAYKLIGSLDKAVADYDRAIELANKDISAWMGRGFVKFQLGKHQEAIEDFSHVIELTPESAVAVNNRGYNYQLIGKEDLALRDYQRAIELAPMYHLALQNKAWLLTSSKEEAVRAPVEAIKTAMKVCEISQFKDFSDLTLLAAAHASAGEFETAIGWQEKSVEFGSEAQKKIAETLMMQYQAQKEFDPKLLESVAAPTEGESASQPAATTTPETAKEPESPKEK